MFSRNFGRIFAIQGKTWVVAWGIGFLFFLTPATVGRFHLKEIFAVETFRSLAPIRGAASGPAHHTQQNAPSLAKSYARLPIAFEANQGQEDPRVRFLARGHGYDLFLTSRQAVLMLGRGRDTPRARGGPRDSQSSTVLAHRSAFRGVVTVSLIGADRRADVMGLDALPGKSNYFIGNDPTKWHANVPTYSRVKYINIYPGVDLVYYGNQSGSLEHDFIVAPGADPNRIELAIDGDEGLNLNAQGDLEIAVGGETVALRSPDIYQETGSSKKKIAGHYLLHANRKVSFVVSDYDHGRPLVIDPVLIYSTYLGGSGNDRGNAIAVDSSGNAYVTGSTLSPNFPTANSLQSVCRGCPGNAPTAFVTKINASGSALVYSTFLGGSGGDQGNGIAVDADGNVYVTGTTSSTDFPIANAIQAANGGGSDAFITKIDVTGSALLYSTYLGGNANDFANGIALDSARNAYITGGTFSANFPTVNPLQAACASCTGISPASDAFVAEVNAVGSALVFSTFFGGTNQDQGNGIAIDSGGDVYVTGSTASGNFPVLTPLQNANAGGKDAFVTKIAAGGSALIFSTYLGGKGDDQANAIALDSFGNAFVAGSTSSSNFPTVNPLQAHTGGLPTGFVSKISATGTTLLYSTYLGGSVSDSINGIAVDSNGSTYVIGSTSSRFFPTVNPLQRDCAFNEGVGFVEPSAFLSKIDRSGNTLLFSTCLGGGLSTASGNGMAVDGQGNTYLTGFSGYSDVGGVCNPTNCIPFNFPVLNALHSVGAGGNDMVLAKLIQSPLPTMTTLTSSSNPAVAGRPLTLTATITSASSIPSPNGTVQFQDGGVAVASAGFSSAGVATLVISSLAPGAHNITASYSGDVNYLASGSDPIRQQMSPYLTTNTLQSGSNPTQAGQSLLLTATVASTSGNPSTGSVQFADFGAVIGTGTLHPAGASSSATFSTSSLSAGPHEITAIYVSDGVNASSVSNTVNEIITTSGQTATTITLTSTQGSGSGRLGQHAMILSTALIPGAGSATGTISFYSGTRLLASTAVDHTGHATIHTNGLNVGANSVTAAYSGDINFAASISPVAVIYRSPKPR